MSDNWIILVPEIAGFVPPPQKRESALAKLRELAPKADEAKIEITDTIRFEHCGGVFEGIRCPVCAQEIEIDRWQDWMDEDFGDDRDFKLKPINLPCCGASKTLHDLDYKPAQGFARFSLETMNPNIGDMPKTSRAAIEQILGCPLRVIYRRM